ncbi:MAG: RagB/SusD family nutrient uptake outer membrane protein [Bacteroidales bacterium]|nr:RagB/SusD family nutrient uptake outer membrane protein [Bacteroidales bacterium]
MKIQIIISALLALLIIPSCEKFIDVDQPDIIEQEQAFSDKNSTRLSMIGLYGLMAELVEPMFLAGEVRADLVIAGQSANSYIKEFSNNTFSASNPYISPKPFYTLINNVNDFMREFESMVADRKMDSVDYLKYRSELNAIRVWSQYQIARIFGSCRYYTHVLNSGDTTTIQEYVFGEELLQKLIGDLTYSDTIIFTSTTEDLVWQSIRFSDYYVNSLLGELYMDIGDYTSAFDKFNELTRYGDTENRKPLSKFRISASLEEMAWMNELFDEDWESTMLLDNAVFMIAFDNKYNQTNELWNWTSSLNYQVEPAGWYIDQFRAHAYSNEESFDYRFYSLLNPDPNIDRTYSINKYTADDRPFIMMRTARIELMKAYCLNLQGKAGSALTQMRRVRQRIDFPEIDDSEMPSDDAGAMIWIEDKIIEELAYENGFEGQRWFDLMRVAKRRNDPAYLADRVAQKYSEESREKTRNRLLDEQNWYIPVFE